MPYGDDLGRVGMEAGRANSKTWNASSPTVFPNQAATAPLTAAQSITPSFSGGMNGLNNATATEQIKTNQLHTDVANFHQWYDSLTPDQSKVFAPNTTGQHDPDNLAGIQKENARQHFMRTIQLGANPSPGGSASSVITPQIGGNGTGSITAVDASGHRSTMNESGQYEPGQGPSTYHPQPGPSAEDIANDQVRNKLQAYRSQFPDYRGDFNHFKNNVLPGLAGNDAAIADMGQARQDAATLANAPAANAAIKTQGDALAKQGIAAPYAGTPGASNPQPAANGERSLMPPPTNATPAVPGVAPASTPTPISTSPAPVLPARSAITPQIGANAFEGHNKFNSQLGTLDEAGKAGLSVEELAHKKTAEAESQKARDQIYNMTQSKIDKTNAETKALGTNAATKAADVAQKPTIATAKNVSAEKIAQMHVDAQKEIAQAKTDAAKTGKPADFTKIRTDLEKVMQSGENAIRKSYEEERKLSPKSSDLKAQDAELDRRISQYRSGVMGNYPEVYGKPQGTAQSPATTQPAAQPAATQPATPQGGWSHTAVHADGTTWGWRPGLPDWVKIK